MIWRYLTHSDVSYIWASRSFFHSSLDTFQFLLSWNCSICFSAVVWLQCFAVIVEDREEKGRERGKDGAIVPKRSRVKLDTLLIKLIAMNRIEGSNKVIV